jgi:hypothetical protein
MLMQQSKAPQDNPARDEISRTSQPSSSLAEGANVAALREMSEALNASPKVTAQRRLADTINGGRAATNGLLSGNPAQRAADLTDEDFAPEVEEQELEEDVGALSNAPVQRKVPVGGETSKPEPQAGSYRARGGQTTVFDAEKHARSQFSFGTKTRTEVFQRYNPQKVGDRIVSIRAAHGEQVNVEGVQLDHQTSWDNIAAAMTAHNKAMKARKEKNINQYYTLWDAKMYYSDQSNLVPALGALNASAGAKGVNAMGRIHYGLESAQGTLQTSWMNLQAGLTTVGGGMSDAAAEKVATLMLGMARAMNEATELLL